MNFLVDAQLPRRVAIWLTAGGCDAIHTLDMPNQNRTSDEEIVLRAEWEDASW
jgi:predicted nuclease of predicted toxin-antitoxin system